MPESLESTACPLCAETPPDAERLRVHLMTTHRKSALVESLLASDARSVESVAP